MKPLAHVIISIDDIGMCHGANAAGDIEVIEPEAAEVRIQEYQYLASDGFGRWLETPFTRGPLSA